jgi:hypothetical protein
LHALPPNAAVIDDESMDYSGPLATMSVLDNSMMATGERFKVKSILDFEIWIDIILKNTGVDQLNLIPNKIRYTVGKTAVGYTDPGKQFCFIKRVETHEKIDPLMGEISFDAVSVFTILIFSDLLLINLAQLMGNDRYMLSWLDADYCNRKYALVPPEVAAPRPKTLSEEEALLFESSSQDAEEVRMLSEYFTQSPDFNFMPTINKRVLVSVFIRSLICVRFTGMLGIPSGVDNYKEHLAMFKAQNMRQNQKRAVDPVTFKYRSVLNARNNRFQLRIGDSGRARSLVIYANLMPKLEYRQTRLDLLLLVWMLSQI